VALCFRLVGGRNSGATLLSGVSYEPFGAANNWTWGDGVMETRTFTTDSRLASVHVSSPASSHIECQDRDQLWLDIRHQRQSINSDGHKPLDLHALDSRSRPCAAEYVSVPSPTPGFMRCTAAVYRGGVSE
jgi:hypothetical protein